jgi:hypothetical protein
VGKDIDYGYGIPQPERDPFDTDQSIPVANAGGPYMGLLGVSPFLGLWYV